MEMDELCPRNTFEAEKGGARRQALGQWRVASAY